jgi:hypothetical protein
VTGGDGGKFPTPPFNVTVWPTGVKPTTSNAEIARVTAIVTDTLTLVRAQEGSTARSIVVGDQIAATVTTRTLTDIENEVAFAQGGVANTTDLLEDTIFDVIVLANSLLSDGVIEAELWLQVNGTATFRAYFGGTVYVSDSLGAGVNNEYRLKFRVMSEQDQGANFISVTYERVGPIAANTLVPLANSTASFTLFGNQDVVKDLTIDEHFKATLQLASGTSWRVMNYQVKLTRGK